MKKILLTIILSLFFLPTFVSATIKEDVIFDAKVVEILAEEKKIVEGGKEALQQNIKLVGLEGKFKDRYVQFTGIRDLIPVKSNIYKINEKVLVVATYDESGSPEFFIIDYKRNKGLLILAITFVLVLLIVGRWKGLRSIISLIFTFFVIIKFIIPQILNGANPVFITLIGCLFILLVTLYITEGFQKRTHIAVVSTLFSLIISIFISWFFVSLTKITSLASEEITYLVSLGSHTINVEGLLLAGIIIGVLGVLDDVVISQVATVEQIIEANKYQTKWEVFKKAYKVGVSHISSMTNTLFLAYTGASVPLLLLFVSGNTAFNGWSQIANSEIMAVEIVRTLSGSIGLILAVPISTFIASWWFKKKN